jgi:hypothetical protein
MGVRARRHRSDQARHRARQRRSMAGSLGELTGWQAGRGMMTRGADSVVFAPDSAVPESANIWRAANGTAESAGQQDRSRHQPVCQHAKCPPAVVVPWRAQASRHALLCCRPSPPTQVSLSVSSGARGCEQVVIAGDRGHDVVCGRGGANGLVVHAAPQNFPNGESNPGRTGSPSEADDQYGPQP